MDGVGVCDAVNVRAGSMDCVMNHVGYGVMRMLG
jgi:hypothetical protein